LINNCLFILQKALLEINLVGLAMLESISSQGCDEVQGYYFAKPLSVKDFQREYLNE